VKAARALLGWNQQASVRAKHFPKWNENAVDIVREVDLSHLRQHGLVALHEPLQVLALSKRLRS
jgi:hypothetical protein